MAEKVACNEILKKLRSLSNPRAVEGMTRFGINPRNAYGVSIPNLRAMAKNTGKNHLLAQKLWASGVHEARILASMIDDPVLVSESQMEDWVKEFDSWDVCDQCCANLFDKTPFAFQKAMEWSKRGEEFVKRAGFVMMATLAVHDKKATDQKLGRFLSIIKRESADERNFVRKGVNWALRQIGKRNRQLNRKAIETARVIQRMDSDSSKWVATDAIRELASRRVQERLKGRRDKKELV